MAKLETPKMNKAGVAESWIPAPGEYTIIEENEEKLVARREDHETKATLVWEGKERGSIRVAE
jgi:hypothetical protein